MKMLAMRGVLICFLILSLTGVVSAQSKKKKKNKHAQEQQQQQAASPNALNPSSQQKQYEPKKSNRKSSGATYESEQEYYDRMARLFKEKRKAEKEMEKPQYSNPMYFGHKRPPKKHKAGKLKFCKECGLRH
jgi:hypothetical protein